MPNEGSELYVQASGIEWRTAYSASRRPVLSETGFWAPGAECSAFQSAAGEQRAVLSKQHQYRSGAVQGGHQSHQEPPHRRTREQDQSAAGSAARRAELSFITPPERRHGFPPRRGQAGQVACRPEPHIVRSVNWLPPTLTRPGIENLLPSGRSPGRPAMLASTPRHRAARLAAQPGAVTGDAPAKARVKSNALRRRAF